MVTDAQIKEALESGMSRRAIAAQMKCGRARVGRIAAKMGAGGAAGVTAATGGFSLEGRMLMSKRPTDVWGPRLNSLKPDVGYLPDALAAQYGCSINTLRERARAAGAIRYTLDDSGQYIEVITNPKTRGGK